MASVAYEREMELQRIINNTYRYVHEVAFGITRYAGANIALVAGKAMAEANKQTAKTVVEMLTQIADNAAKAEAAMPGVYLEVSRSARAATMAKLEKAIARGPGQYRTGQDRVSGGRLLTAVENWTFIPTNRGVRMLNKAQLTTSARQWARLNFGVKSGTGAGDRTRPISETYEVKMSNVSLGRIGVLGRPGPPMMMPRGPWQANNNKVVAANRARRRKDRFMFRYLTSESGVKKVKAAGGGGSGGSSGRRGFIMTEGIETVDYLSAGAEEMARAFTRELNRIIPELTTTKGHPNIRVIVRP